MELHVNYIDYVELWRFYFYWHKIFHLCTYDYSILGEGCYNNIIIISSLIISYAVCL